MFRKKNPYPDITKSMDLLSCFASAVDFLENRECAMDAIGAVVANILEQVYEVKEDDEIFAAASQVASQLHPSFMRDFYAQPGVNTKCQAIFGAVKATDVVIKEGRISDDFRRAAANRNK